MSANHAPHRWSDEDVESLLTEFFRREMPSDLARPAKPAPSVRRETTAGASRLQRSIGYTRVGLVACVLLLAVTALSPTGRRFLAPPDNNSDTDPVANVDKQPDVNAMRPEVNVAKDRRPDKNAVLPWLQPGNGSNVMPEDPPNKADDWQDFLDLKLYDRLPRKPKTPRRLDGPVPFSPKK